MGGMEAALVSLIGALLVGIQAYALRLLADIRDSVSQHGERLARLETRIELVPAERRGRA